MRKSTLAAAVLMLAAFPGGVCADVVHLKNGRSFHGTIESETKASVVIKTTDGGSMTLPRGLIASIEHETVAPGSRDHGLERRGRGPHGAHGRAPPPGGGLRRGHEGARPRRRSDGTLRAVSPRTAS